MGRARGDSPGPADGPAPADLPGIPPGPAPANPADAAAPREEISPVQRAREIPTIRHRVDGWWGGRFGLFLSES